MVEWLIWSQTHSSASTLVEVAPVGDDSIAMHIPLGISPVPYFIGVLSVGIGTNGRVVDLDSNSFIGIDIG